MNPATTQNQAKEDRVIVSTFDSNYQGFDPELARKLAELTQQAYNQFDDRNDPKREKRFQLGKSYELMGELYDNQDPFGFVACEASSQSIFVVFRGTKKLIEWFKDVNIPLVNYHNGKDRSGSITSPISIPQISGFGRVTVGFRQIYTNLRQEMIDALARCPGGYQVFVTGHSLGGALATLAIPDILNNTSFKVTGNITLYTFASPRCGDREFAEKFKNEKVKHWRIANTEDVVTMFPYPTGNIRKLTEAQRDRLPKDRLSPEEIDALGGNGGVKNTLLGKRNPNPFFGFLRDIFERNRRRMPDYVHTGTPIYFTIHEAALERHHNLNEVYMLGISQPIIPVPKP
jgi:Lipase (class 3)